MLLRRDDPTDRARPRREPERDVLHRVLLAHLATFVARTRVHRSGCGRDELVAFSCKGRGSCPSWTARRMADTAAHLVGEVLPDVAVRQWVLSFPFRIRFLLACDPKLCCAVRRIFVRSVLGFVERRAREQGHASPRSGAVVCVQRFGGALKLVLHFHALVLDGAYGAVPGRIAPCFHAAPPLEDEHVAELARTLHRRVTRYLQRLNADSASTSSRVPRRRRLSWDVRDEWIEAVRQAAPPTGALAPHQGPCEPVKPTWGWPVAWRAAPTVPGR